jgi:2'-5' RNA ligase
MITCVETAIALLVPEAQRVLTDAWAGSGAPGSSMPAHVTLLYPFVEDPDPGIVEELRFFFAGMDGFELSFSEIGEFPEVVFLHPDQAAECQQLTEALVRRWPEFPPYSGLFDEVVPHLTVVKTPDADLRERVRSAVEPALPVRTVVREASLWGRDTERWRCVATFPLGPAEPA